MSTPYIGEIRMFAGNFAPRDWAFCDGRLLPITEYETLFQLIGTTYGGDGQSTFALPNLQGRIPVHMGVLTPGGRNFVLSEMGGVEEVTLGVAQMPSHTHTALAASGPGFLSTPANAVPARHRDYKAFANAGAPSAALAFSAVASVGGNQPHENMPPFLALSFIIALYGIFPSQT